MAPRYRSILTGLVPGSVLATSYLYHRDRSFVDPASVDRRGGQGSRSAGGAAQRYLKPQGAGARVGTGARAAMAVTPMRGMQRG